MVFVILALLVSSVVSAQTVVDYSVLMEEPERQRSLMIDMNIGYEHLTTVPSNVYTDMTVEYTPAKWVTTYLGFKVNTDSRYALNARADFKYHLNTGYKSYIGLKNQYLYNISAGSNLHDMVIMLAAAYSHPYVDVAIGANARLMTPIKMYNSVARTSIWEPGLVYDIEARIFPLKHVWNIGAQITNMRMYEIERMYQPNFILKGNYRIMGEGSDDLNLKLTAGFQPAGMMNVAVSYYSFFFNVGITCAL